MGRRLKTAETRFKLKTITLDENHSSLMTLTSSDPESVYGIYSLNLLLYKVTWTIVFI
jgi:hypothetical protein